ncbi:hypothetical protein AVEN_213009-1 [Araneus ventricosus]|uniref:Uncharacterized protein n=1 Tax=Araneus ventricosus TaxID=182803 RepID=A0A4Y2JV30_ARAVE|nr:hypothetical protein AVEN_213009-1 [Araneus ventricosus]
MFVFVECRHRGHCGSEEVGMSFRIINRQRDCSFQRPLDGLFIRERVFGTHARSSPAFPGIIKERILMKGIPGRGFMWAMSRFKCSNEVPLVARGVMGLALRFRLS